MSDYCAGCHYNKKKKIGEDACPFNTLYWDFYHRHRNKLENNPRIGFVYNTLDKMKGEKLEAILEQAAKNLDRIEDL
jgi:deoxyribodipyrimidine photolyase-related protein